MFDSHNEPPPTRTITRKKARARRDLLIICVNNKHTIYQKERRTRRGRRL